MADPAESERKRLSALYAQLDPGELEDLARDAPLLSPVARAILQQEIARRNLKIDLERRPMARDEVEYRPLVTVDTFRDLPEALLAKGRLEAAGIESFTSNENIVRIDWFWSNAVGGIKLQVKPEDVEAAQEILQQPIAEGFEVEGEGEYEQPRCPNCESLDVSFEDFNKGLALTAAWLLAPLPWPSKAWKCHSCGQRWQFVEPPDEAHRVE